MISFNECDAQVGGIDTSVGLKTDVSNRWNSTYVMLESAIKYRRAFGSLSLFDKNLKTCPSNGDWERAEKMQEFLLPFYVITNLFSGSSYPTSNMYFMQIWKIECLLIDNMGSGELVVHDMAMKMKEKFDKYWSEYSVILAIASILDPRMEFHMLKFCYSKLDPFNWEQKLEKIKRKLYELFAHYEIRDVGATSSSVPPSQATSTQHLPSTIGEKSNITSQLVFGDYMDWSQNEAPIGKSELDKYLDEPRLEPQFYQDLDVLQHWKAHKSRYPSLSKMACNVLSISIPTVASEATFNTGSRVLNNYRSSLHVENAQALICTRNWLNGFEIEDDENENDKSNQASSSCIIIDVYDEEDEDELMEMLICTLKQGFDD